LRILEEKKSGTIETLRNKLKQIDRQNDLAKMKPRKDKKEK